MKALSLPISSPSRPEKFTPPQPRGRFLTGNAAKRGRTRPRGISSIFGRKNAAGLINNDYETTEEPSSPKVTCIGQVRARRATAAAAASHPGHTTPNPRRWCWWLKKPLFGYKFPDRFRRYRNFRKLFFKWVLSSSRSGYGKKVDFFAVESDPNSNKNGDSEAKVQEIVPGNALSLTRCRSVPRRSSSFGGWIWESTPESFGREVFKAENKPKTEQNFQEFRNPSSEISVEIWKEGENTENVAEDLTGIFGVAAAHPILLTRCKSTTARTAYPAAD